MKYADMEIKKEKNKTYTFKKIDPATTVKKQFKQIKQDINRHKKPKKFVLVPFVAQKNSTKLE